jgi:hypothetical protein
MTIMSASKRRISRLRNRKWYNRHKDDPKWRERINSKRRARRLAHPLKSLLYKRDYKRRNRRKIRESVKLYHSLHPRSQRERERTRLRASEYYQNNPLRVRRNVRRYKEKNPDKVRNWNLQASNNRRARKFKSGGSFSLFEFGVLCNKYGNCCIACGRTDKQLRKIRRRLAADHIVPISLGGLNTIDNIQPLCHAIKGGRNACNNKKHKKHIDFRNTVLALSLKSHKGTE